MTFVLVYSKIKKESENILYSSEFCLFITDFVKGGFQIDYIFFIILSLDQQFARRS